MGSTAVAGADQAAWPWVDRTGRGGGQMAAYFGEKYPELSTAVFEAFLEVARVKAGELGY